jgi:hypothetical protein
MKDAGGWFDQMVGIMSWLDAPMPAFVYILWQAGIGALLVWGFVLATWRGRLTLLALGAGTIGVPFLMQVAFINKTGLVTSGRYLLPMAAALPIFAALLLQRSGLAAQPGRSVVRLLTVVLLPLHLVCLGTTMVRWQRGETFELRGGLAVINPLTGSWQPPLGSVLPLVLTAAGTVLLGWVVLGRLPAAIAAPSGGEGADGDSDATGDTPARPASGGPVDPPATRSADRAPDGAVSAA